MDPSEPFGPAASGGRPGYPLRGLSWGLLGAVVAALVLFAAVLVAQNGRASGTGEPAAAPASTSRSAAPVTSPPPAGAVVSRGELAAGWESDGWSWDSTVSPAAAGPDGSPAVAVTYRKPYGGYALRSGVTTEPAPTAVLRVRVLVTGKAIRLGLQVQSSDDGELGPIVPVDVPAGRWTTVSAPLAALRPSAGVRRISVIAQNVQAGTMIWVSDVTLR